MIRLFYLFLLGIFLAGGRVAALTNKTFSSVRLTEGAKQQQGILQLLHGDDQVRSSLTLESFYEQSLNARRLGRCFGIKDKEEFTVGKLGAGVDVPYFYFIHRSNATHPVHRINKIILKPRYHSAGMRVSYLYKFLEKDLGSWFVSLDTAFVTATHNLDPVITAQGFASEQDGMVLQNYFFGTFEDTDVASGQLQEPLRRAKFHNRLSESGISSVAISLGKVHTLDETASFYASIAGIIPTAKKNNGEFLFEPVIGNGGHFGIKGNLGCHYDFSNGGDVSYSLDAAATYEYLFPNHQIRTLGIRGKNFGHYYLLARRNQLDEPLVPASNILTQKVKVLPGSALMFHVTANAEFNGGMISLGYGLTMRQQECIKKRQFLPAETYAIPSGSYDTHNPFDGATNADFASGWGNDWLQDADIDHEAAAIPGKVIHEFIFSAHFFKKNRKNEYFFKPFIGFDLVSAGGWSNTLKTGLAFGGSF